MSSQMSAASRGSEKLSLPVLQSKMKSDPEGYDTELTLIHSQFNSAVDLFKQQAALSHSSTVSGITSDSTLAKDLSDRAMFLAHVTPFYPQHLSQFPRQLADFLRSSAKTLPSALRCHVTQALILLVNRKMTEVKDNLELFMELQILDDRNLRKLAFSHVIHSIKRMNKKHKNETQNRALQNILFSTLQQEDEARAKRALITLCELHRRKVWFDDRTANAICMACFHSSSRIMIAALSFLLDYEKIEDDDDSDASSSDDESSHTPQAAVSKEAIYKAHHKGTIASKKKKKAKLQRAMRSMKRQQRLSSNNENSSAYYSPLNHLKDAQGFVEKLYSRLQTCHERFEVKMMILKVIARTIGLHRLILLNFYPYLQKYCQPHQRDITNILAAAVQACHDMVPPDAVEPLFKQIVNQFVHDKSRPEAIAVGLNVIRELCLRIPLLMNEDLLQDLVMYKKTHEKAVSAAARSLMMLFREICPSLLLKKDRGRPGDPKARPKAYGEIDVATDIPGLELLHNNEEADDDDSDNIDDDDVDDELALSGSDDDYDTNEVHASDDEQNELSSDNDIVVEDDDSENSVDDGSDDDEHEEEEEELDSEDDEDLEEAKRLDVAGESGSKKSEKDSKAKKRKFADFDGQLLVADTSLRALKKLAEAKMGAASEVQSDGILSNEDFQRIRELKAKKEAKIALSRQGLKIPTSDQLSVKRVNPAKLEAHIRVKLSKEERLALVKAGREERGKFQARAAVKQKKTGGLSNRQKEAKKKKTMPMAAKRAKESRSRQERQRKSRISGKQFRGKKAWK